jgi:hypothetical protein
MQSYFFVIYLKWKFEIDKEDWRFLLGGHKKSNVTTNARCNMGVSSVA